MIRERIKHSRTIAERSYTPLKIAMFSTLLFAVGVAISLFLVSRLISNRYVEHNYLSEERRTERIEAYKDDLQKYVSDHALGCEDTKEISKWANGYKYLYVLIYKDDELLFESGQQTEENTPEMGENKENKDDAPSDSEENGSAETDNTEDASGKYPNPGLTVRTPSRDELIAEAVAGGSYKIEMSDGVLLASMVDYTEYLYYDIFNVVSLILAFLGFLLVMWFYFFETAKRITRLAREVTAVADGDITRTITADGEDEITGLCTDVEYMRSSMLENIEKERSALEANRELITAMSHDIRTPLTVLLGYLDIMKLNAPDGDMQQYIEASERTALRLKKMSDDMFSYFLVYGGGIEVSVQECEARTLVDQMLSGHVFLLREQGYTIEFNFEGEDNDFLSDTVVVTDPPQLMRIVENIFSNVMKYADLEKPVKIYVGANSDEMEIRVSNCVRANPDEAQKNGIGMRSCMKLANAMDIIFATSEEDGVFTTKMAVPIIPSIEYGDDVDTDGIGGFREWLRSVFEKSVNCIKSCAEKTKALALTAIKTVKKFAVKLWSATKACCRRIAELSRKLFTRK